MGAPCTFQGLSSFASAGAEGDSAASFLLRFHQFCHLALGHSLGFHPWLWSSSILSFPFRSGKPTCCVLGYWLSAVGYQPITWIPVYALSCTQVTTVGLLPPSHTSTYHQDQTSSLRPPTTHRRLPKTRYSTLDTRHSTLDTSMSAPG